MGTTLLYGIVIAVPAIIIAGPLFAKTLKNVHSVPLQTFQVKNLDQTDLPGTANSFISSLLPVMLLILTTLLPYIFQEKGVTQEWISFFSDPVIVMLLSLAGLSAVPKHLYEAAAIDRAGPFYTFFRITLPLVAPILMIAIIFRTMEAFKTFDLAFIMTSMAETELIAIRLYKMAFQEWQTGRSCALAYIVLIMAWKKS